MTQERNFSFFARIGLAAVALSIAGAVAFVGPVSSPAFAASEPSGGGNSGDSGQTPKQKCEAAGKKWDATTNKCVPKSASLSKDKKLYDQGRELALAGKYEDALATFAKIKNQKDAKVLTMIGYSKRKMGDVDGAFAFYQQALAIDPNNLYTHEYLGEGYVQKGDLENAKVHLAKLEVLCGTTCEQYKDLAAAIAGEPSTD